MSVGRTVGRAVGVGSLPHFLTHGAQHNAYRITHQTQQKISRPYFVVRFFTVNIFLQLTVKILSFLRLTAKG